MPPHVVEDDIGLRLLHDTDVLARYVGPEAAGGQDAWLSHLYMGKKFRRARAGAVARARLVDDIVTERADRGVGQYVILGAGLDSFALRHSSLLRKLRVFEVDEPGTQAWKRRRLHELGMESPQTLAFVPVNFERQSWAEEIARAGFDRQRPAVVSSLGVTQYLSPEAIRGMLRGVAGLARGTTFVCGFVLPVPLIAPEERKMRAEIEARAASRGHPWRSVFSPDEIRKLAHEAGFAEVGLTTGDDLAARYFAGRKDGLRPISTAYLIASG
jgi:methyltransferase (TIGR00027 family)